MKILKVAYLFAATVSAVPQTQIIQTDAVSRNGRRFIIRKNVPEKRLHERANQVIPVVVGGPQDTFVPNVVTAAVGDVVQFQFSNGNHTVTQSSDSAGCVPLQATVPTAVHSGHVPFVDGQTTVGTFSMVVSSTAPMFLYCATGPHCQEGQVMVINPTDVNQVVNYAKLSQSTTKSTDGTSVVGGTLGQLALTAAAFTPAPVKAAAPAAAAPAAAPAVSPAPAGASSGTTTTLVTVTVSPASTIATPAAA